MRKGNGLTLFPLLFAKTAIITEGLTTLNKLGTHFFLIKLPQSDRSGHHSDQSGHPGAPCSYKELKGIDTHDIKYVCLHMCSYSSCSGILSLVMYSWRRLMEQDGFMNSYDYTNSFLWHNSVSEDFPTNYTESTAPSVKLFYKFVF